MSTRCKHMFSGKRQCKRFTGVGQDYCRYHNVNPTFPPRSTSLPRGFRPKKPEDLFLMLQEMIALTLAGEVAPTEACALYYLANAWMRLYVFLEQRKDPLEQWARVYEALPESVRNMRPLAKLAKVR